MPSPASDELAGAPPAPPADKEVVLGEFLRSHRERLKPDEVGLAPGRRRRTPGLRREEVAQLAGLSATWVTWLEQGRSVRLSARALSSLAAALRLSRAERAYLFELAGKRDPQRMDDDAIPPALSGSVHAIGGPAYLLDAQWNAIAWNAAAATLFVGWLDQPGRERNLLRAMFLSAELRALVQDWPVRAARLVAEFRAHSIRRADDASTRALIESLMAASPEFRHAWMSQDVEERDGGRRGFRHPERGNLQYEQLTMIPAAAPTLMLVMLLPARGEVERSPPVPADRSLAR